MPLPVSEQENFIVFSFIRLADNEIVPIYVYLRELEIRFVNIYLIRSESASINQW